jgi:argininosuccinate lyase
VAEIAGAEPAGHLHTARSRNDQVATDMRQWLREEVSTLAGEIARAAAAIAAHARQHVDTVCPGFTHGQPAMVTSWGHWTMSYLPRLVRVARQLGPLLRDLSTCPLGAAASYGTSWPIDRRRTATMLGFKHPTPSGTDGIWSRGEMEGRFATIAAQWLGHLSGIGQDLILLSSPPRDWIRLADEHVTGSSIMPQKRNPDFAEVTRSRAHAAVGFANALAGIGVALPAGYNRDTQWTKYLAMDAADNVRGAGDLFARVFAAMTVNARSMREACAIGFLNATDVADFIARTRRVPFRQCYRIVGPAVKDCEPEGRLVLEKLNQRLDGEGIARLTAAEWATLENPEGLLAARTQPGNPAPGPTLESIDLLEAEVREECDAVQTAALRWRAAIDETFAALGRLAAEA